MKLLRMLGVVAIFTVSLTGLQTPRAAAVDSAGYKCKVTCCNGQESESFAPTVDEAWQNLSCPSGFCGGTIECDVASDLDD
jgi:hypothetical protein